MKTDDYRKIVQDKHSMSTYYSLYNKKEYILYCLAIAYLCAFDEAWIKTFFEETFDEELKDIEHEIKFRYGRVVDSLKGMK